MEEDQTAENAKQCWLYRGAQPQEELARFSDACVMDKIEAGEYTRDEIAYIEKVDLQAVKGSLQVSKQRLEKLRRLCQCWEIDITVGEITSHRKIIGPLIVAY